MKPLSVAILAFVALLQYGILCENTKPQLKRRIQVWVYRPAISDFSTKWLRVFAETSTVRKLEPDICGILRRHVDSQMKYSHEKVYSQLKPFFDALERSTSNDVSEQIAAVGKANDLVISDLVKAAQKAMSGINSLCASLGSAETVLDVQKQLIPMKSSQKDAAFKLKMITQNCENEMQSNYVPLGALIDSL